MHKLFAILLFSVLMGCSSNSQNCQSSTAGSDPNCTDQTQEQTQASGEASTDPVSPKPDENNNPSTDNSDNETANNQQTDTNEGAVNQGEGSNTGNDNPSSNSITEIPPAEPDDDQDGVANTHDNCINTSNPDQLDTDGDTQGDVCDEDKDGDQVDNTVDNCPLIENPQQLDTDSDQSGDLCDSDRDNDGVNNDTDNCQLQVNTDQADQDNDGIGDVCDKDYDNDGVEDDTDNCLQIANADQLDTDEDGQGNVCDSDDDSDAIPDAWELKHNLNPIDGLDYNDDIDGDGFINFDEYKHDTDPNDADSHPATVYPSTQTAWVIPGNFEAPTDPDTKAKLPDAKAVQDWELTHADSAFGGSYGARNDELSSIVGYMYNQKLEFNPGELEMSLRNRAEAEDVNYEDFFLHFKEDTVLEATDLEHGSLTPFNGRFTFVGATRHATDRGRAIILPSTQGEDVWQTTDEKGALYVFLFEPFTQLEIDLVDASSGGQLQLEYPSAINDQGMVTQWTTLSTTDGTNHLQQEGDISWQLPTDWKRAATFNRASLTGSEFEQPMLQNDGRYYVVRLALKGNTGARPTLADIKFKSWITAVPSGEKHRMVPGWDDANDKDGNGIVDDTEFASRTNVMASARFRYQARVVPVGNMWSEHSSFCRTDLSNKTLRHYFGEYYRQNWEEHSYTGAYNDSLFRLLGDNTFKLISGGTIAEYQLGLNDDDLHTAYTQYFSETLRVISRITGSHWISANISANNLFTTPDYLNYYDSLDAVLREDYLFSSIGMSGFFGISKAWDNFALAKGGRKSIHLAMNKAGRVVKLGNTQENWEKDIESGLALYYLFNVPGLTYYQAWNSSYMYGSGNTRVANASFWKAGVPQNYAYHPEGMLNVDIGKPSGVIPAGKSPLQYMTKTKVPLYDYTLIGDSTDTVLQHDEIGRNGSVEVMPSYIYHLKKSDTQVVNGGPSESILARNYTNGLVLFRTNFFGHNKDFMQSDALEVVLPGSYRRVKFDGSLGEPINTLLLEGYEGVVLVKE